MNQIMEKGRKTKIKRMDGSERENFRMRAKFSHPMENKNSRILWKTKICDVEMS